LVKERVIPEDELKELLEDEDYNHIKGLTSFFKATCTIVFTISSFIYTLQAYFSMLDNEMQVKYMFNNWEQRFVENMVVYQGNHE